jgi:hypothetical protein
MQTHTLYGLGAGALQCVDSTGQSCATSDRCTIVGNVGSQTCVDSTGQSCTTSDLCTILGTSAQATTTPPVVPPSSGPDTTTIWLGLGALVVVWGGWMFLRHGVKGHEPAALHGSRRRRRGR